MAPPDTIRTRILLLSDTHGALPLPSPSDLAYRQPLPAADIVIHSGDLTGSGKLHQNQNAIELLRSLRAELKIVIPGNHDLTLDSEYCCTHPRLYNWDHDHTVDELRSVRDMYTNEEARNAGIVYIEEGIRTFRLANGAEFTVYASAYTPEFCDWGFAYPRTQDRFNDPGAENPIPEYQPDGRERNIDILVTHGPPYDILDETSKSANVGCKHLARAIARCKPLLHCFGHIHEAAGAVRQSWLEQGPKSKQHVAVNEKQALKDMGAFIDAADLVRGEETLFVNASIMNLRYVPDQTPWVVDLFLPRTTK